MLALDTFGFFIEKRRGILIFATGALTAPIAKLSTKRIVESCIFVVGWPGGLVMLV